jgi:outer membrane protein OmpA-like peptidoglycan-associated protein
MNQDRNNFFWPSYVDLMTALFLVMLVLFVLSYKRFQEKERELNAKVAEKEQFDQIMAAIQGLKGNYFRYNTYCKRHELSVDAVFEKQSAELPVEKLDSLFKAGEFLRRKIAGIKTDLDVKYLIVVEGRAAKDISKPANHADNQDGPTVRDLSFRRAMALVKYWEMKGLNFNQGRFEIVAAGSGFKGACRYEGRLETRNRRFVIQILPKVGSLATQR